MSTPTPKSAAVRNHRGRPTLFIDARPVTPDFYALTHNYGVCRSWYARPARNLRAFAGAGIRLFQVDLYFEDIWREGEPELDIALLQRQVRGVLDACPDAGVVVRIHVNAPFWWNAAHPGECTVYGTGPADKERDGTEWSHEAGDLERAKRASLASPAWREEAGRRLAELCRRFPATPEGASVIGLHVAGGVFGEWHYWAFLEHEPDFAPAMTVAFRAWLRARYGTDAALRAAWRSDTVTLDTAELPGIEERKTTTAGLFRDPVRERRVIDYYRCQHAVVADDIEYFCRIVKETWPRPVITGVFYGYFHMMFNLQATGGHLEIERILNSPWVDYLSAPQSYFNATRGLGGSGHSRGIIESTLLHGKLWLDELDNGGIRQDPEDPGYYTVVRRSAVLPLMRGIGFWYYDFGFNKETGWWESPVIRNDVAAIKALFDRRLDAPYAPAADALVVWDDESYYYLTHGWTPISSTQPDDAAEDLWRSGVVADHIYLFDLDKVDLARYKAIVFTNTYAMSAAQRAFVRERAAADGRHLIWNYLPGYTDGTRLNLAFVEELTGLRLAGRPMPGKTPVTFPDEPGWSYVAGDTLDPAAVIADPDAEPLARLAGDGPVVIARKRLARHTSVHAILPMRGPALYRRLLRDAGCHVYSEGNDPLYAGSGLLMLHAADGGMRTIRLKNGRTVQLDLKGPATILLDAESGEVLLGEHAMARGSAVSISGNG